MTLKENRERFIEREGLKVCSNFTVENFNCFNCIENGTWEYCNNYKKREKVAPQEQSEDKAKALQEMKNYDNLVEEEERLRNLEAIKKHQEKVKQQKEAKKQLSPEQIAERKKRHNIRSKAYYLRNKEKRIAYQRERFKNLSPEEKRKLLDRQNERMRNKRREIKNKTEDVNAKIIGKINS